MSTTETAAPAEHDAEAASAEHDEHMHPSDWKYVQIAIILAVLTAAEVATYYIDTGPLEIPILITIMIVKFVLVLMWFMHLKYEGPLFKVVVLVTLGTLLIFFALLFSDVAFR